jgi:hypothetical protein
MRFEFFFQIKDLARFLWRNWSSKIWVVLFFFGISYNTYQLILHIHQEKSWWGNLVAIGWWFIVLYFIEYRQYKKCLRDGAKKLMMMDPKERYFYNEWGEYDIKKGRAYTEQLKKELEAMAAKMGPNTVVRGSMKLGGKTWQIGKSTPLRKSK